MVRERGRRWLRREGKKKMSGRGGWSRRPKEEEATWANY